MQRWSKYYTWNDRVYCSFMIAFMRALEPRRYKKDEIILRDLEETEEIIFVLKGEVKTWHHSKLL